MKTVKFGLIGCGLMAREFASAAARWCHLNGDIPRPEIVGICSVVPAEMEWFKKNFPNDIKYAVTDYQELLNKDDIDAIYCAVPHNLHEQFYIDIINSGKALLGESPSVSTRRPTTRSWRLSRLILTYSFAAAPSSPTTPLCRQ